MSWGNPQNITERFLATALKPASWAWALGSSVRLQGYRWGCLKRKQLNVPVISVGNLTCGGTGKTPVTIDLAHRLIAQNKKVAILSRGYQRQSKEQVIIVSDGTQIYADAAAAGDEPYMMAQAVPQAVVLVGSQRAATAELAVRLYGCDVILLDDGFQHLAIKRNQDIVLIDYHDDPLKDSLLPAGRLREPVQQLERAHWIVITKVPDTVNPDRLQHFESLVNEYAPHAQLTSCKFSPVRLRCLQESSKTLKPQELSGLHVTAFSGIARPESFHSELSQLGAQVMRGRSFADHHWFNTRDIEQITNDFRNSKAELVITTAKDAVRLNPSQLADLPVYVLELGTEWLGTVPALQHSLHVLAEST